MIVSEGDSNLKSNYLSTQIEDKVSSEGNTIFLIAFKWWKQWLASGEDGLIYHFSGPGPVYCSHDSHLKSPHFFKQSSIDSTDLFIQLKQEEEIEQAEPLLKNNDYVILPEQVWTAFQKWYNERSSVPVEAPENGSVKNGHFVMEVYSFPAKLRLLHSGRELTVRVGKQESKAWNLLTLGSEEVRIWDYFRKVKDDLIILSKQTDEVEDSEMEHEICLDITVAGCRVEDNQCQSSENGIIENQQAVRMAMDVSTPSISVADGPTVRNTDSEDLATDNLQLLRNNPHEANESVLFPSVSGTRALSGGLTGLQNLGNTCFMNSALQCLVHTPQLVDYFLGDYSQEINRQNPLGMKGEIAVAFGELLQNLWSSSKQPFAPRTFKMKLARFAPQFNGYNQHDSQEVLSFLLDGLHEDLNRVKQKPYIESKDMDDRPENEVANENWENHKKRNDSVIVDVCQGQYKSTLVCPICNKVSVTFDPFMYLSLPLILNPTFSIKVFSSVGRMPPTTYTVSISKQGRYKDLVLALTDVCKLQAHERLVLTERHGSYDVSVIDDLSSPIRNDGQITAHRLSKTKEEKQLVVFMNRDVETYSILKRQAKYFGCPLVACIPDAKFQTGDDLLCLFQNILQPLAKRKHVAELGATSGTNQQENARGNIIDQDKRIYETGSSASSDNHLRDRASMLSSSAKQDPLRLFQFYLVEERFPGQDILIELDKPLPSVFRSSQVIQVAVTWSENAKDLYDVDQLDALTDTFSRPKQRQETASLYSCLEGFLKEEPLGVDDMWYCPRCKDHRQASKKLDLWRLPEILVVHLKRFSYSRYLKKKLETFVDFPIHDLDLTKYNGRKDGTATYELYAISNHYGSMGGGHYTAYAKLLDNNRWYHFDDSHVSPVSENEIKTAAAYLLFYRRIKRAQ